MRNKIRLIASSVSVAALTLPALALAQLDTTAGGSTQLPTGSVFSIITKIMNWLLGLVGIIGVIGFAIAGILYLTAAGDEDRINSAKSAMMYSIIGVIVALVGLVALQAANSMLGSGTEATF